MPQTATFGNDQRQQRQPDNINPVSQVPSAFSPQSGPNEPAQSASFANVLFQSPLSANGISANASQANASPSSFANAFQANAAMPNGSYIPSNIPPFHFSNPFPCGPAGNNQQANDMQAPFSPFHGNPCFFNDTWPSHVDARCNDTANSKLHHWRSQHF
jgi:hypothetical protein